MEDWIGSDTTQGSAAWIAARGKRLGGSEIAAVLRISPYKKRRELWEEKTGRRLVRSIGHLPHVRRGIEAEPVARDLLERRRSVVYTTPVLVHPRYPWAVASLDGLCATHTLEIKTMSLEKHLDVRDYGEIPDYYECQLQWGLWIAHACGLPARVGLFASYRPEDGSLYETWIRPAIGDGWDRMERAALEFWGWVESDTEPAEDFVYGVVGRGDSASDLGGV